MKVKILDIKGKEKGTIELPECFNAPIREDIVSKVLEAKKTKQPYAPSPIAGNRQSASGKLIHRRHVWKSQYGRGMSRIPRKRMSQRGSQFNWVGATVPSAVGGRRAHPPKIESMIKKLKINKKELRTAFFSALTATTKEDIVVKRYEKLEKGKISQLPIIIESKEIKVKELVSLVKKIFGEVFSIAIKNKKIRAGKGKMRGRKYKSNAGLLIVVGKKDKLRTKRFEVVPVNQLSVNDLAKGGQGRLVMYTENAIKEIAEKIQGKVKSKSGEDKK